MCIQKALHLLDLFFKSGAFTGRFRRTIIHMYIPLPGIGCIHKSVNRLPIHAEFRDLIAPVVLEGAFLLTDLIMNKVLDAFHHDNKCKSVLIHELQVFLAEVAPVQNETNVVIAIPFRLCDHVLQL